MENMPEAISTFLAYKETIQNCSPLTVSEYCRDLITFFRYIIVSRRNGDLTDISNVSIADVDYDLVSSVRTEEIYGFLLYLSRVRKNQSRARARKLSAIKAFYKYHTIKSKKVSDNPAKDIDSPTIKMGLPKYLELDESIRLLKSVDRNSENFERDYCIITLFLNCGMRLSELVGIDLTDINEDLSKLVVTGKGNKMRTIYLNQACRDAINDYLAVRQKNAMKYGHPIIDKNALFLSSRNRRISNQTVQWMIQKQLKLAGLDGRGFSVHKLRHTAATLMYNEGNVDVRVLKDILGHEQLTTTQIYTHVSDKKLEEAVDANPLAKIKK